MNPLFKGLTPDERARELSDPLHWSGDGYHSRPGPRTMLAFDEGEDYRLGFPKYARCPDCQRVLRIDSPLLYSG